MVAAFPGSNPAAPANYLPPSPPPVFSPSGSGANNMDANAMLGFGQPQAPISPYGAPPSPYGAPAADQFAAAAPQPYPPEMAATPTPGGYPLSALPPDPSVFGQPQAPFSPYGAAPQSSPYGAPTSPVGAPVPPPAPGGALLPGFAPPPGQPDPATAALFSPVATGAAPFGAPPSPYGQPAPGGFAAPQAQAGGLPNLGLPTSPMGVNYLA